MRTARPIWLQGFIVGYVAKVLMLDKSVPTTAVFIASLLGFLIIPFAGWLSDRFGRRITYRGFCLLLIGLRLARL